MPGCLPLARPSCSWPFLVLSVPAIAAPSEATNTDQLSLPSVPSCILSLHIQHGVWPDLDTLEQPHNHIRTTHGRHLRVVLHFDGAFNNKVAVLEAVYLAISRYPPKLPLGLAVFAIADEQPALAARDLHAAGRQEGQHTAGFTLHLFQPPFARVGAAHQGKTGPLAVIELHGVPLTLRRQGIHHYELPVQAHPRLFVWPGVVFHLAGSLLHLGQALPIDGFVIGLITLHNAKRPLAQNGYSFFYFRKVFEEKGFKFMATIRLFAHSWNLPPVRIKNQR